MGQAPSPSEAPASAELFLELIRRIQKVDAEFPIQYAMCLTEISLEEGCSVTRLAERTGLALSTVSRIVGALSDYRQRGEPFGFIDVRVAKADPRRRELFLTPLGKTTLASFLEPIEKHI